MRFTACLFTGRAVPSYQSRFDALHMQLTIESLFLTFYGITRTRSISSQPLQPPSLPLLELAGRMETFRIEIGLSTTGPYA